MYFKSRDDPTDVTRTIPYPTFQIKTDGDIIFNIIFTIRGIHEAIFFADSAINLYKIDTNEDGYIERDDVIVSLKLLEVYLSNEEKDQIFFEIGKMVSKVKKEKEKEKEKAFNSNNEITGEKLMILTEKKNEKAKEKLFNSDDGINNKNFAALTEEEKELFFTCISVIENNTFMDILTILEERLNLLIWNYNQNLYNVHLPDPTTHKIEIDNYNKIFLNFEGEYKTKVEHVNLFEEEDYDNDNEEKFQGEEPKPEKLTLPTETATKESKAEEPNLTKKSRYQNSRSEARLSLGELYKFPTIADEDDDDDDYNNNVLVGENKTRTVQVKSDRHFEKNSEKVECLYPSKLESKFVRSVYKHENNWRSRSHNNQVI
jgi:hypothetical protein